jgi:hypothetical protein
VGRADVQEKGWLLIRALPPRPKRLYVIEPVNDLQAHQTFATDCACAPVIERKGGATTIVHNAFDGRELVERYGLM